MKYKNRLIVPTVVTLSLLGISGVTNAEEKNDAPSSLETIPATEENSPASNEATKNNESQETESAASLDEKEDTQSQDTQPEHEEQNNLIHNSETQDNENNVSDDNSEDETIDAPKDINESSAAENNSSSNSSNNSLTTEEDMSEETQQRYSEDAANTEQNNIETSKEDTSESTVDSNGNKPSSANVNEKETNKEVAPIEEVPSGNHTDDIKEDEKITTENDQNTSKVIQPKDKKESTEKTELGSVTGSDTSTNTQLESGNREEDTSKSETDDKEKALESKAEVFGMKTFALPASATLKAETFKKTVDAAPQYDSAYYAARVSSGPNSGRYSPVTSDDSKSLGWLENRTLFISQQAKYNGTTFYKIHSGIDGPMQGWVKEEDLRLFDMTKSTSHKKTYDIKLDKHHLLTEPWGTENQYVKRLDQYGDTPFHAEKYLELGAHKYYYGKIGNDRGWLEESRLVDTSRTPFYRDMNVAARVKSGSNSGRYSPVTSKNSVSLGWLENRTLF